MPQIPMYCVWIALAVLFLIVEGLTPQLITIWFAAGAAAGLIASLAGAMLWLQITVFFVVSVALLLLTRPLAKRLNQKAEPLNADRVIGATATVTEAIDNLAAKGQVRVNGQIWTARAERDATIPAETLVTVLRVEGVKVIVEPLNN